MKFIQLSSRKPLKAKYTLKRQKLLYFLFDVESATLLLEE